MSAPGTDSEDELSMITARRILAATSSTAAVLALAGPTGAATVATSPCVLTANGINVNQTITGAGFTPGALVTLKTATKNRPAPVFLTSATADPAGDFSATVGPPSFTPFGRKLQTFDLGAFDGVNPALVATTAFQRAEAGYTTNPASGRPTVRATHTVRGFPTGRTTYLHFRFGGHTKRNVKLGTSKGACGVASRRMALLPTPSHPGVWTVYADQTRSFSKSTRPQLKSSFRITGTFGG
jgi:hypothetical protein